MTGIFSRLFGGGAEPPRATTREEMDAALRDVVVPHLRTMGFAGSMPHFRRLRNDAADLLGFQFRSSGGAFVVELGRVAPQGFDFHGQHVPLAKARFTYLRYRHRLGAPLTGGDHWFKFDRHDPAAVARSVCEQLDRPEPWALIDSWPFLGLEQ